MVHNLVAICKHFSFEPPPDTSYDLVESIQFRRPFADSMVLYVESPQTAIRVDDIFQEFRCDHQSVNVVVVQYFEYFDCLDPVARWANRNVV